MLYNNTSKVHIGEYFLKHIFQEVEKEGLISF